MKVVKLITIAIFLLISSSNYADSRVDSLKVDLSMSTDEEESIILLLDLASQYLDVNIDTAVYYTNIAKINLLNNPGIYSSAYYYHIKGLIYNKTFKNDSAIIFYKTSYSLYNELDSIKDLSRINTLIANCFHDLVLYDSSLYYYNLSFAKLDSINHTGLYAANLNNIANVYDELGDKIKTLNYYLRALTIFKQIDDLDGEAITTNNIGLINLELKNYNKAIKYFQQAADINFKNGNNYHLCANYNSIGLVYKELAQYNKAIEYINMALEIANESNFDYIKAQANHNLGGIYTKTEEYKDALTHFNLSLNLCIQLGIIRGEVYNIIGLGEVYTKLEKFKISEEFLLKGLELCRQTDFFVHYEDVYDALMKNYQAWGKYQQAFNYYKRYVEIRDSVGNLLRDKELNEIQTKYESEQKEIENQRLKDQNKLQEFVIFRQRIFVTIAILIAVIVILMLVMMNSIRKKRKERIAILQTKNKLIRDKSEQLKISNQTKDKLFSIIAHDLRSPFTSLLGFTSILREEAESNNFENVLEFSQQLNSVATSTFELIDNLLNWSRSQQDSIKPSPLLLLLNDPVKEIMISLKSISDEKKIIVISSIPDDIEIYVDRNMVMVIIRNLLSNALKFTKRGGEIIIGCNDKPGKIEVFVADNGLGIDPIIKEKLFSDNSGHSSMGTENEKGSGLGLMLVKDFVIRIGGEIWVESTLGKGSTFRFTIPKNKK